MIMGKPESNSTKVKEIILEVEPKTKAKHLIEYLLELNKITSTDMYVALETRGHPLPEDTTISSMLKQTRPQNGVIRLYLYEQTKQSMERLDLKRSRLQNSSSTINPERSKSDISHGSENKKCCCF